MSVNRVHSDGTLERVAGLGVPGPQGPKGDPGSGSVVEVTQVLSSGTKIAEIDVDGDVTELFAPTGGSGSGDMLSSVYDPDGDVAEAGGIAEYVEAHGGGSDVTKEYVDNAIDNITGLVNAEITDVNTEIDGVKQMVEDVGVIVKDITSDFSFTNNGCVQYHNGNVISATTQKYSDYVDISNYRHLYYSRIKSTSANTNSGIAFYKDNKTYISGVMPVRSAATWGMSVGVVDIPSNAKYIRATGWIDEEPSASFFCYASIYETEINPLKMFTVPNNEGTLNTIKNMRQFTDGKFTTAFDLVRVNRLSYDNYDSNDYDYCFEDKFESGKEYKGMPYSERGLLEDYGYYKTHIGDTLSFETFLSAALYDNSIIAEESTYNAQSRFASVYGVVCSSVVCNAINLPVCNTSYMSKISGMTKIGKVVNNGTRFELSSLALCDILLLAGTHVAMITDIKTSSEGVELIEISEATSTGAFNNSKLGLDYGGKCRRIWWTPEELYSHWASYEIYRYSNLANVKYNENAFVSIDGEPERNKDVFYPCIPYMGEKFTYKKGHIANHDILVSGNGFSNLRVLKDGETFDTYSATNLSEITAPFADSGKYEAFLCNISNGDITGRSKACHWMVSDASVSVSESNGQLTVTCVPDNIEDVPIGVIITTNNALYPCIKNFVSYTDTVLPSGKHQYDITVTVPSWASSLQHVKVRMQNGYGQWETDQVSRA